MSLHSEVNKTRVWRCACLTGRSLYHLCCPLAWGKTNFYFNLLQDPDDLLVWLHSAALGESGDDILKASCNWCWLPKPRTATKDQKKNYWLSTEKQKRFYHSIPLCNYFIRYAFMCWLIFTLISSFSVRLCSLWDQIKTKDVISLFYYIFSKP